MISRWCFLKKHFFKIELVVKREKIMYHEEKSLPPPGISNGPSPKANLGRCDRNFSKVATARGFARGLLALAKCSARCDRNP